MTKIALRKAWFQVHKWIGLILAILIIPISLTGSALVWDEGLDRLLHPDRFSVSGPAALPPAAYVEKAKAVLGPGEAITRMTLPDHEGAVEVQASQPGPSRGRPPRTLVFLDPADGHVIEKTDSRSGLLRTFHIIHGSLMIPGLGRQIVGWIGVAMLISALSGLWLWWPTVGKWVRGLRWRRHRNFDTNLHHLMGFWIALPLAILSLTGAWISFPQFFGQFDGKQVERRGPDRGALMRAKPLAEPRTPLPLALDHADSRTPGPVRAISWPTELQPQWTITKGRKSVTVEDATGAATLAAREARGGGNSLSRLMRTIHDGHDTPFLWQLIVFLGGILPAILAVTGVIMWWRARGWRAQVARRQRQART